MPASAYALGSPLFAYARMFRKPRVDYSKFKGEFVPKCSPFGKLLTVLVHCGISAFILWMTQVAYLDSLGLHLTIIHIAVLLGAWGPKAGTFEHWWVPDAVHELSGSECTISPAGITARQWTGCSVRWRIEVH